MGIEPVATKERTTPEEGYASADFIAQEAAKLAGGEQPVEVPDDEESDADAETESDTSESNARKHWSEHTISDDDPIVKNKFFKGKTAGDVYKSYEELERKLQEQGRELNRRKSEEALADAIKSLAENTKQPQPEAKPEPADAFEALGIDPDRDLYLDGRGTLNKVLEFERKRIKEELMREVDGKHTAAEKARVERESSEAGQKAFFSALDGARDELGLSPEEWGEVVPSVMTRVGTLQQNNPEEYNNAAYDPTKIASVARSLRVVQSFLENRKQPAEAAQSAPKVEESPNPPGSTRPAGASVSNAAMPTLKSEERDMAEELWPVLANKLGLGDDDKKAFFADFARKSREMGARR